ncbi:MAG: hypothetical protein R3B72_36065 [Polyangiaceae bacterium]
MARRRKTSVGDARAPRGSYARLVRDLGAELHPAQRVLTSVAFDGVDPADLDEDDRAIARELFGQVDAVPEAARGVFVAVCGARAGKSRFLCGTRLLHLAATVPVDRLAPGESAYALIVAPDLRLARQTMSFALGAAKSHPQLKRRVVDVTANGFGLKRRGGQVVTVECLPASRGGSAVRGRSLVGAALDESCFFRDVGVVTDADVYKALAPRVMKGGQLILASTPWTEAGLTYELHRDNHGLPTTALVCNAPTLLLNPDMAAEVERERQRDPESAEHEYGCAFLAGGASEFFDAATVRAATELPPIDGARVYFAAADFAFVRDSSALAIVALGADGRVELVSWDEVQPKPGKRLVPSEVCDRFARELRRLGVVQVMADHHYSESVREHLARSGVVLVPAPGGNSGKDAVHTTAQAAMREGKVRIPPAAGPLMRQLRSIVAEPTAGGRMTYRTPRTRAGHGDLASAFLLATWYADASRRDADARTGGSAKVFTPEGTVDLMADDEGEAPEAAKETRVTFVAHDGPDPSHDECERLARELLGDDYTPAPSAPPPEPVRRQRPFRGSSHKRSVTIRVDPGAER